MRYVSNLSVYVYADSDEEAKIEAKKIATTININHDLTEAVVEKLYQHDFGNIIVKPIKID